MAKKVGCPMGQKKIKGTCTSVLQKDIRASWCRKSFVGDKYPFAVTWEPRKSGSSDWYQIKKGTPIIKVSKPTYNKIAKTLDEFPKELLRKGDAVGLLRKREYGSGKSMDVFVVTDGKKHLIVDPQGFDYPRYKSPVKINEKVLPY